MPRDVAVVGVPSALGGSMPGVDPSPAGMARAPTDLRRLGLIARLRDRPELADSMITDAGDVPIEAGFRDDPDVHAKNADLIAEFLPRERALVVAALSAHGEDTRLVIVGGDCIAHAGALAGLRQLRPSARFALAWFDAHGDANDPIITPTGNVWGMPFAMIMGRGAPRLVAACDGPTVQAHDAALVGGQILDEQEARLLAAGGVAHFGSGMLGTDPGMAALDAWSRSLAGSVDALYIAIDMDALDGSLGYAVQMPEANGLSLATAVTAVRTLAQAIPLVGVGVTGLNLDRPGGDQQATLDAVVELLATALSA